MREEFIDDILEATTSADIVFLPSGFTTFQKKLETLARLKNKWQIKILERPEGYLVKFGDGELVTLVERGFFGEFCKRFLNSDKYVSPVMVVDLFQYLKEAIDREMESLYEELEEVLEDIVENSKIRDLEEDARLFRLTFGGGIYQPVNAVIDLGRVPESIRGLIAKVKEKYADDRGAVEMLIDSLEKGRPIPVELDRDNLAGVVVVVNYAGVRLIFEGVITHSWQILENIYVDERAVVDELEEKGIAGVKVEGGKLYPTKERFTIKDFQKIKDTIKDVL